MNSNYQDFSEKVLIAIPAFNEASSLPKVLEELLNFFPPKNIIVVSDGSTDNTPQVAAKFGVEVLDIPFNIGVGGAMRTSFKYALSNNYKVVVQIDADGQHDPKYVQALLNGLETSDVVVGSRFAGLGSYRIFGPRRWAMRVLAYVISVMSGKKMTDVTSGFRATGPRALLLFKNEYPSEYLGDTVESLVIAIKSGLVVSEVPVEMRHRFAGKPSQSLPQAIGFFLRSILVIFLALIRPGWNSQK